MSSWGQGTGWNWRRTRVQVLERDNYECQLRFNGCTFTAVEVHHRFGLEQPGRRQECDPDMCVAVCRPCHDQVTNRQRVAGQLRKNAARRARLRLPEKPHPGA